MDHRKGNGVLLIQGLDVSNFLKDVPSPKSVSE